ncbi:MAG: hypothetical protein CR991_10920 [Proteobacteria bacterium]|nr:MAG: hypothetical protein CR991_10920 [Pseudomonadota bacterium]
MLISGSHTPSFTSNTANYARSSSTADASATDNRILRGTSLPSRSGNYSSIWQTLLTLLQSWLNDIQQPADIKEVSHVNPTFCSERDSKALGRSNFSVPNKQMPEGLLGKHVVANQQQLDDFAKAIGVHPKQMPQGIDFNNYMLLYTSLDAGDPNRFELNGTVDWQGNYESHLQQMTRMPIEPSDETAFQFFLVDRSDVKQIVTDNPYNEEPLV